jgi:hypothetical protein
MSVLEMSTYKPWKALERRHAKRMKGVRLWRPDFSDSIPDGENSEHTWDCKAYASIAVIAWFVEAERKYRDFTNGRNFHLCLFSRKHPASGDFILITADRHQELLAKEEMADGVLYAITEFDPPASPAVDPVLL